MKYGMTILLLAVISAPLAVLAEDKKKPITDEKMEKMQQRLELTDEQLAEMRKIRDDGGSNKEIRAVLNDEQKAQAQEMKKKRKEKSGEEGKRSTAKPK